MADEKITTICYADDAVLLTENEDDLQKMLHNFNKTTKTFNMIISAQ